MRTDFVQAGAVKLQYFEHGAGPELLVRTELRWLNRYHLVPPMALAAVLFLIGGWGMLVWGFFISTALLWHTSSTILDQLGQDGS